MTLSLKQWSFHYISGDTTCMVFTDYKSFHYDMNVYYHLGKANVVEDALRRLSMGSVVLVEKEMKELVKDVHWIAHLGFQLISISCYGVTIQNGAEPSFVLEVKENQDNDPILLELRGTIHNQSVEVFLCLVGLEGYEKSGHIKRDCSILRAQGREF